MTGKHPFGYWLLSLHIFRSCRFGVSSHLMSLSICDRVLLTKRRQEGFRDNLLSDEDFGTEIASKRLRKLD